MHPEGSGAWGQGEVVCFVCLGGRACFGMQLQARLLPAGSCRPWLLPAGSCRPWLLPAGSCRPWLLPAGSCRPCLQAVASQPQSWPQTATSCVSRLCRPTPLGARWWPPSTSPAARCSSSLMTCWCWRRARWAGGGARGRGAGCMRLGLAAGAVGGGREAAGRRQQGDGSACCHVPTAGRPQRMGCTHAGQSLITRPAPLAGPQHSTSGSAPPSLLLLSLAPQVLYHGPCSAMVPYFGRIGYSCPTYTNPGTWRLASALRSPGGVGTPCHSALATAGARPPVHEAHVHPSTHGCMMSLRCCGCCTPKPITHPPPSRHVTAE